MAELKQAAASNKPGIPYPLLLVTAATALIAFGFSHTVDRVLFAPPAPAPTILWAHVALASTWLAVLVAQVTMVTLGRVDLHRRLGALGAGVGAVMSVVAFFTAVELRKLDTQGDAVANIAYLAIPLAAWVTFTVPFALALAWRRNPALHRPLMIMAACAVVGPALGRIPEIRHAGLYWAGLIPDLMMLSAMIHERCERGRWSRTYAVGIPVMAFTQGVFVFLQIAQPPAWIASARWLMSVF